MKKILTKLLLVLVVAGSLFGSFWYGQSIVPPPVTQVDQEAIQQAYVQGRVDVMRFMFRFCSNSGRLNFQLPEGTTPYIICMPDQAGEANPSPGSKTPDLNSIHPKELDV